MNDLAELPSEGETWVAGSVPVRRWIVSRRGRPLRPDAFVVLSEEEIIGVQVEPEGPGPIQTAEIIEEMMRAPLSGPPRRPARILVEDEGTARYLGAELEELGIKVGTAPVSKEILTRIRSLARATAGIPIGGLLDIEGMDLPRLTGFFSAAARFHRVAPWHTYVDGDPFEIYCDSWSRSTWYGTVLGALGEMTGLALHPSWAVILAIFEGRAEHEGADTLALAFGNRTQVPFDDLDAAADHGLEVDGNDGHPLAFRSRPGGEFRLPTIEEMEILEGALLAFAALVEAGPVYTPTSIVEVETCTGRHRIQIHFPD